MGDNKAALGQGETSNAYEQGLYVVNAAEHIRENDVVIGAGRERNPALVLHLHAQDPLAPWYEEGDKVFNITVVSLPVARFHAPLVYGILLKRPMFKRTKENFVCERCGESVTGDGYTNHCPLCLYSKHVDIYPGDRAESCNGLMMPIRLERKRDGFVIVHQCGRCGEERSVKARPEDTLSVLLDLP